MKVGNGKRIKTSKVCRKLQLLLQGVTFRTDFYVFTLDGEDLVLGMEWLEGFGSMKANFKELTLQIKKDRVNHTLKGDPTLSKGEVSAKAMMQELQGREEGYLVDCIVLQDDQTKVIKTFQKQ